MSNDLNTPICPEDGDRVPAHVAIIMDGNGRWAQKRGQIRLAGHRAGVRSVRRAIEFAGRHGIRQLTLFAFSSENWKRPETEVSGLMELFSWALSNETKHLADNNIRFRVVGDTSRFPENVQTAISEAERVTSGNTGLRLVIAANYGGRWDIARAVQLLLRRVQAGEISVADVDEDLVTASLAVAEDVDLLIRTGGERRISNFLLWQLAYSEIYISDVLWPDFDSSVFQAALDYYRGRERRFGRTSEQVQERML
ncbi:polyprenyl diphosphate synthase [Succinimonas amylolytica]|uniref:polyprenyl diphosphate synthase n=1 Tax=Succinimonas amylolytica TaxID=83769 RepID=UPI000367F3D8|nr:polyprenyl diphosphate synthase [Succinimonas amylolytica]